MSGPVVLSLILMELAPGFSFGLGRKLQLSSPSEDHLGLQSIYRTKQKGGQWTERTWGTDLTILYQETPSSSV